MEITVHSRFFLARYKGCTNARFILPRNYGHEEFKYLNPFSVQRAHKGIRDGQYLRPMQRRIVPSMKIRVLSRLILARCKGCTNAKCILSGKYGHEEFKNVNPISVQQAHKAVRAGQYLRPMQRRIVPSKEIRVHSRLILARYKGCTNIHLALVQPLYRARISGECTRISIDGTILRCRERKYCPRVTLFGAHARSIVREVDSPRGKDVPCLHHALMLPV